MACIKSASSNLVRARSSHCWPRCENGSAAFPHQMGSQTSRIALIISSGSTTALPPMLNPAMRPGTSRLRTWT
eukprot:808984-Amphidinium_carterae.1